jgi:hypothetical protein
MVSDLSTAQGLLSLGLIVWRYWHFEPNRLPPVCGEKKTCAADLSCRTIRRIALPKGAVYAVLVHTQVTPFIFASVRACVPTLALIVPAHRTVACTAPSPTPWRRIDLMHGADHQKRDEPRRDRGSSGHHRHDGKIPPHLHTHTTTTPPSLVLEICWCVDGLVDDRG